MSRWPRSSNRNISDTVETPGSAGKPEPAIASSSVSVQPGDTRNPRRRRP